MGKTLSITAPYLISAPSSDVRRLQTDFGRFETRGLRNRSGVLLISAGIGYTLLPCSGIEAFTARTWLKAVSLPDRRYHEHWSTTRRGPEPTARLRAIMRVVSDAAGEVG